jgi:hypothetical protein
VQYTVYNEFEERRSVTKPFTGQQVGALEDIDSIFTVGTEGTLTGQTQLISTGSGILAVAVEAHQDPGSDARGDSSDQRARSGRAPRGGHACCAAGSVHELDRLSQLRVRRRCLPGTNLL